MQYGKSTSRIASRHKGRFGAKRKANGSLRFEVSEGATATCNVLLVGDVKVVKAGAGTFIGAKSGQSYTGGTVVNAGLVKSDVGVTPWGAAKALVTVADTGAAFDWNAMVSTSATVQVKLGGRAVKSSVPLITWATKPANFDSIKFAACDRGGSIRVKDDGVYFTSGFMIIVR